MTTPMSNPFVAVPVKTGAPQKHMTRTQIISSYRQFLIWESTAAFLIILSGFGAISALVFTDLGPFSLLIAMVLGAVGGYQYRHILRLREKRAFIFTKRHYIPYPIW